MIDSVNALPDEAALAKFSSTGVPRHFRGNTVLSMIDPGGELGSLLWCVRRQFEAVTNGALVYLPASSWHMTMIGLVIGNIRSTWPRALSDDAVLADADSLARQAVESVHSPIACRVRAVGITVGDDLRVQLVPADHRSFRALWSYRDAVSAAAGIRAPNHDAYSFHVTLAYRIKEPAPKQKKRWKNLCAQGVDTSRSFVLEAPSFRYYEDMTEFTLKPVMEGRGA